MNPAQLEKAESRILSLSQSKKDAELTFRVLHNAGIECLACSSSSEMFRHLDNGAGAVILPEEYAASVSEALERWLQSQAPWSDLPILVLARPGGDSDAVSRAMHSLGNVTVLERPMRISALVSATQSALRARARQYQIREYIDERQQTELELREDDRRKDEFLAILAHELRNPLAPLRNALDYLGVRGSPEPELNDLRQLMERQVDHMIRLVDDLLEISRVTRGKIDLRLESVDVAAVMLSAIETSRPQIEQRGHRLDVSLPGEPITVDGDPVRLAQVFANLLNNASKYTDPGGVINFEAHATGNMVEISVQDTGNGISGDMLEAVFEIFRQVGRDRQGSQGGLGIGLTLAKRLVGLHGGTITATSDGLGKGSLFTVQLPRRAAVVRSAPPDAPARASAALGSVLLVDDNRDAAIVLGALLEERGAEVRVVFSGEEALNALQDFHPMSIILDLGMPEMSGHEVAKRIGQMYGTSKIKLIALTGWGQPEQRARSKAAGFHHHLVKPVDLKQLESILSGPHPAPST